MINIIVLCFVFVFPFPSLNITLFENQKMYDMTEQLYNKQYDPAAKGMLQNYIVLVSVYGMQINHCNTSVCINTSISLKWFEDPHRTSAVLKGSYYFTLSLAC